MIYGILGDLMLAFILGALLAGLVGGVWLVYKGLSGILRGL